MVTIDTISHVNTVRGGRLAAIFAAALVSVSTWFSRRREDTRQVRHFGRSGFWAQFYVVRRSRRGLANLDDRMLRDIGISRRDAIHEAGRWRWDRQW